MADLRMNAYYYSFEPTGVELIDRILSAVACAGKGYHHTEDWSGPREAFEPFRGASYIEFIQNAANDAAVVFTSAAQHPHAFDGRSYRSGCVHCGVPMAASGFHACAASPAEPTRETPPTRCLCAFCTRAYAVGRPAPHDTPLPLSTLEQAIREAVTEAFGPEFLPIVRDKLVKALLEKLAPRTAGGTATGWQPMEIADGYGLGLEKPLIVFDPTYEEPVIAALWDDDEESVGGQCWRAADAVSDRLKPLAWHPWPAPPAGASE